jgi:hypothetical protein
MLERNFDLSLIGRNYLSLIFGISLLDKKRSVLVLDDERLQLPPLFSEGPNELERQFLAAWGERHNIDILRRLSDILVPRPVTFIFDGRMLRLGNSPWSNARELARKLDGTWDVRSLPCEDEFNEAYFEVAARMAKGIFRSCGYQQIELAGLLIHCPQFMRELFERFFTFFDQPNQQRQTLLSLLRAKYHLQIGKKVSREGLFHLFLSVLSPQMVLKTKELEKHLTDALIERGGQLKRTSIREWRFHRGRPWSVELASYEGIVHPRKMAFIGGSPKGLPLKIEKSSSIFSCVTLACPLVDPKNCPWSNELLVIGHSRLLGTRAPFVLAEVGEKEVRFHLCLHLERASKIEFVRDEAKDLLLSIIGEAIAEGPSRLGLLAEGVVSYLGPDLWPVPEPSRDYDRFAARAAPHLRDATAPSAGPRLQGVHYFGPMRAGGVGPLSTLIDLREQEQFL